MERGRGIDQFPERRSVLLFCSQRKEPSEQMIRVCRVRPSADGVLRGTISRLSGHAAPDSELWRWLSVLTVFTALISSLSFQHSAKPRTALASGLFRWSRTLYHKAQVRANNDQMAVCFFRVRNSSTPLSSPSKQASGQHNHR